MMYAEEKGFLVSISRLGDPSSPYETPKDAKTALSEQLAFLLYVNDNIPNPEGSFYRVDVRFNRHNVLLRNNKNGNEIEISKTRAEVLAQEGLKIRKRAGIYKP